LILGLVVIAVGVGLAVYKHFPNLLGH